MSYGGSPVPGTKVQALAGADFCTIIKGSQLEVLRENSQVLQPTAGDQPQTQVNEGGKLLHRTPRTSNRARSGQLTPWSLLFRYVGEITSGRICWSSACQIKLSRICGSDHVWSDILFGASIGTDLLVRSVFSRSDLLVRSRVRSACQIRFKSNLWFRSYLVGYAVQTILGQICWSDHVSDLPVRSGISRICGSGHIWSAMLFRPY